MATRPSRCSHLRADQERLNYGVFSFIWFIIGPRPREASARRNRREGCVFVARSTGHVVEKRWVCLFCESVTIRASGAGFKGAPSPGESAMNGPIFGNFCVQRHSRAPRNYVSTVSHRITSSIDPSLRAGSRNARGRAPAPGSSIARREGDGWFRRHHERYRIAEKSLLHHSVPFVCRDRRTPGGGVRSGEAGAVLQHGHGGRWKAIASQSLKLTPK